MEHACNHFVVHASGYLTAVNSDVQSCTLTFDLAPEQYTHAYKDYNKNLKPGFKKSSLPLCCIIKPSPRWTMVPKLQVGHTISVLGFLSHVLQQDDGNRECQGLTLGFGGFFKGFLIISQILGQMLYFIEIK